MRLEERKEPEEKRKELREPGPKEREEPELGSKDREEPGETHLVQGKKKAWRVAPRGYKGGAGRPGACAAGDELGGHRQCPADGGRGAVARGSAGAHPGPHGG